MLRAAGAGEPVPDAYRYGLGPGDNPIWPGVYEASVLACGGSILAAELVARGDVARAFAFAGGLHHAMPARASGFCYLNDAVLAILALRRHGLRVAYVDIDAHHGDGVQAAFYRSADVLTISTHERGRPPVPRDRRRRGAGRGAGARLLGEPAAQSLHRRRRVPRRVRRGRPAGPPRLPRGCGGRPARHRRAPHGSPDASRAVGRWVRGGRAAHRRARAAAGRAGRRRVRPLERGPGVDGGVGNHERGDASARRSRPASSSTRRPTSTAGVPCGTRPRSSRSRPSAPRGSSPSARSPSFAAASSRSWGCRPPARDAPARV